MTLVKWTPRPMTVFNEVDNMINSVFNRDWNLEPIQSTKWNPAVDVKETDNSFLISADIPGLTKKDINIENENIQIWKFDCKISDILFTIKKPPEEITVKERLNASNDLRLIILYKTNQLIGAAPCGRRSYKGGGALKRPAPFVGSYY